MDSGAQSSDPLKLLELDLNTYGQHLQSLEQRLDAIFSSAETSIKLLESAATSATDQYVSASQQIQETLTAMRPLVEGEAAASADTLQQTTQLLAELEQKRISNLQELESTFQQLTQTLQSIDAQASRAYGALSQEAQSAIASATQGLSQVQDLGTQITQSFGGVDQDVASGVDAMETALQQLLDELEDAQQQHDAEAEQRARAVQAQFAQDIQASVQGLDAAIAAIVGVIDSLEQLGVQFSSSFKSTIDEIADTTDDLTSAISELQPQLEDARHT